MLLPTTFLLGWLAGYVLSIVYFLGRKLSPLPRTLLLIATAALTLFAPLCIPSDFPIARCLLATTLLMFLMKSWDLHLHPAKYASVPLRIYAPFLMNHCLVVPRHARDFLTDLTLRTRLLHFASRTALFLLATLALWLLWQYDWSRRSFWCEHIAKAVVVFLWIASAWDSYGSLCQLLGARIDPFTTGALSAHSPAALWRSWHQSISHWLLRDVVEPLRRLSPACPLRNALCTLTAFVVSGLMHEYMVSLPLHRFTGYMMLFFLTQGLAVIATRRIALQGRWRILGAVLTYAFTIFCAVWLFAPVNEVLPFYANPIPAFLQLR